MPHRPALLITALFALTACDKEEVKPDNTPRVGVLELGTAHRIGDPAPPGPAHIEISPAELVIDGEQVIPLENGKIPAAEKSGYEIPKLKAKLSGKQSLALSVHAAVPYATLARVMYTGNEAGIKEVGFKVRKPNSTNQIGYIDVKNFTFVKSPDGAFEESELLPWDKWTAVWDDSISACQAAGPKADCGYAPMAKAQGGKLDQMLRVRGSGLALRFRQAGVPEAVADAGAPTAAAAEPKKKDKKKKKKKAEMLDGIKAAPDAPEEEPPEPSHEHVFTLRTDQATVDPSPISGIVKPLCSSIACPVVLDVEGISMSGQVFGLLGAAFPDGTTAPKIAWVLPPKD